MQRGVIHHCKMKQKIQIKVFIIWVTLTFITFIYNNAFILVKCNLIWTDLDKSLISTVDCSENIFYMLTFIFGGIIFILTIITLIIKIQSRNTQGKGNSTSMQFWRFIYIAVWI